MLNDLRLVVGLASFALFCATPGQASSTFLQTTSASQPTEASACPSRTINYITQTLPQQCLRTDWSRNVPVSESGPGAQDPSGLSERSPEDDPNPNESKGTESNNTVSAGQVTPSSSSLAADLTTNGPTIVSDVVRGEDSGAAVPEQEEDPLSDEANFVSFEEWKAQMLKKAGQSPDDVGASTKDATSQEGRRRLAPIHQVLDSLGDDAEIELDFGGFGNAEEVASAIPIANHAKSSSADENEEQPAAAPQPRRSREAGKTSRERFNYASLDCAATVLKTNHECKGANSILLENKDSYLLNPCSASNKFFIVELCNDILIDTIVLGNYEFFSSTFRQFRVSISDRYPVKLDKWREVGVFEAQNIRGIQAFLIENGLIWARYLRIEFLSFYGAEYYCPVSLLRVHGKTMMDDYRNDFKAARGEDDPEDEHEAESEGDDDVVIVHGEFQNGQVENTTGSHYSHENSSSAYLSTVHPTETTFAPPSHPQNCRGPGSFNDKCPRTNYFSLLAEQADLFSSACSSTTSFCNMELAEKINVTPWASASKKPRPTSALLPVFEDFNPPRIAATAATLATAPPAPTTQAQSDKITKPSAVSHVERITEPQSASSAKTSSPHNVTENGIIGSALSSTISTNNSNTADNISTSVATAYSKASASAPPASTPSTQESFFKSIHKRLQTLEANSTLSLQYIEEQSRLLREAFTKVEKRQLNKTSSFLSSLNETVLSELREFRTQYDQIWQSTILELSSQREQSIKEAAGLSARLAILADEVLWQKRLVYLQFGLIMLCLGLVTFTRGSSGNMTHSYIDIPHFRDILTRSPPSSFRRGRFRSGTSSSVRHGLETPVSSPSRPGSRHGISWAKSKTSDGESDGGPKSADGTSDYQIPTPPSETEHKHTHSLLQPEPTRTDSPVPEPLLRRAVSSPALGIEAQAIGEEDSPQDDSTRDAIADEDDNIGPAIDTNGTTAVD